MVYFRCRFNFLKIIEVINNLIISRTITQNDQYNLEIISSRTNLTLGSNYKLGSFRVKFQTSLKWLIVYKSWGHKRSSEVKNPPKRSHIKLRLKISNYISKWCSWRQRPSYIKMTNQNEYQNKNSKRKSIPHSVNEFNLYFI